tara:strand:- start:5081 stop:5389 length:309 start_codon:yes stop_codon:yes gene_type:complete
MTTDKITELKDFNSELIQRINRKWPQLGATKSSEFFADESDFIWFKNSEEALHDNGHAFMVGDMRDDPQYLFGTLRILEDFLAQNGYYSEAYDSGTLLAYRV